MGNDFSDRQYIKRDVPQGMVLGPELFNLYVNDLFNLNSTGNIIRYADDIAIFYKAEILDWAGKQSLVQEYSELWCHQKCCPKSFLKYLYASPTYKSECLTYPFIIIRLIMLMDCF